MNDIAIRVEALGKQYRLGQNVRYQTLRESWTNAFRRGKSNTPREAIWALKDISFDVKRGEVVGVIGRNGAGKSTLLKILSRITHPTTGQADIHGRVGSLLEVGTGFHPELTGRENIFLNGAILGMTRREVKSKFDEIVAFAEVERFLDTAVKHYSSGMYVRLAFAVAAHLEPEILLVDEVLAVGDAAFQKKCLGKMGDVGKSGRTVLFVSHNMPAIEALCGTVIWLNEGAAIRQGETHDTVALYFKNITNTAVTGLAERTDRQGDSKIRFVGFRAYQSTNTSALVCGKPACLEIRYEGVSGAQLRNASVSIAINTVFGDNILYLSNDLVGVEFSDLEQTAGFLCRIERLPLVAGSYSINLYCTINGVIADWVIDAARIAVEPGDYFNTGHSIPNSHTKVLAVHSWEMTS